MAQILKSKRYWRQVVLLTPLYALLLVVLQFLMRREVFLNTFKNQPLQTVVFILIAAFICSLFIVFGKFWARKKRRQQW